MIALCTAEPTWRDVGDIVVFTFMSAGEAVEIGCTRNQAFHLMVAASSAASPRRDMPSGAVVKLPRAKRKR